MDDPRGPPPAPSAPDPADCCGQGCTPCVFDLHELAMQRWRLQLARWAAANAPAADGGPGPVDGS